jgi:hypothetical protein
MNQFKKSSQKEDRAFVRKTYLEGMVELLKEYKKDPRPDLLALIKSLGLVAKEHKD